MGGWGRHRLPPAFSGIVPPRFPLIGLTSVNEVYHLGSSLTGNLLISYSMQTLIDQGLSEAEARQRLTADGPNELPSAKPRSLWAIAWGVVSEPMFLLLSACGGIYLFLGNKQDAIILLGSVVVVMGLSFFQERKSERTLEALRDLTSPRALVIRDSTQQRIAGREVVRGDIIMLTEGDRVPADALLLDGQNLSVDESLLTGESVPVHKLAAEAPFPPPESAKPGGDGLPFLFSGTMVIQGKGAAQVLATAKKTALGKIGKALAVQPQEPSKRANGDRARGARGGAIEHFTGDSADGLVRRNAR